jgi:putative Holliday junction resolvase
MILGIDYGKKRVGVAIGEKIAFSRGFFENDSNLIQRLIDVISEEDVKSVVVGIPMKDNGEEGELGKEIRQFADRLKEATDVTIIFENENDTSFASNQVLREAGVDIKASKSEVDGMAAAAILSQYLNSQDK